MARYDPEKTFIENEKIYEALADLDAKFLLGNIKRNVYKTKRQLLKNKYIKLNS